jgi:hypothetical protein
MPPTLFELESPPPPQAATTSPANSGAENRARDLFMAASAIGE